MEMELYRSVKYNGVNLKYYITDKSGEFNEYGIYVSYGKDNWEVEALSDNLEFIKELINNLADTYTLPEFVQELCEEALLDQLLTEIRRKNEL